MKHVVCPARVQGKIKDEAFDRWELPDGTPWTNFYRFDGGYLLRFPDFADFEVSSDGTSVRQWPVPGTSTSTVEHLYLNQVLPLALSRQGKLLLHGSAVDIEGHGVAFIGNSGRGKSTLAASFATSGHRFLTDDGLELNWICNEPVIAPGHPSIRLWEDSREALVPENAAAAPAVHYTSKTRFLAGEAIAFSETPIALKRIYFLGAGEVHAPTIEVMKPAAALVELVRNSFLLDVSEQEILARHFDNLALIANLPVIYHLDYPRRFDELDAVKRAVIAHTAQPILPT